MKQEQDEFKYKVVLLTKNAEVYQYMYSELKQHENVLIIDDFDSWLKGIWRLIYDIMYCKNILSNRYLKGLLKQLCKIKSIQCIFWTYIGKKLKRGTNKPLLFIWYYNYMDEIKSPMLTYLKKICLESKHVFMITDAREIQYETISIYKRMDLVGVYDKSIARQYGYRFYPNCYPVDERNRQEEIIYDICFIGTNRGRMDLLHEISCECEKRGIIAAFYMSDIKEDEKKLGGIQYIEERWHYRDIRQLVRKSRCLLELKNNTNIVGCSLRIQEAVMFNKKILTNNENVYDMPGCGEETHRVQLFKSIDDINWEFVKKDIVLNYQYKNEYSAIKWLEKLQADVIS